MAAVVGSTVTKVGKLQELAPRVKEAGGNSEVSFGALCFVGYLAVIFGLCLLGIKNISPMS